MKIEFFHVVLGVVGDEFEGARERVILIFCYFFFMLIFEEKEREIS
jgi:hypothetical protein